MSDEATSLPKGLKRGLFPRQLLSLSWAPADVRGGGRAQTARPQPSRFKSLPGAARATPGRSGLSECSVGPAGSAARSGAKARATPPRRDSDSRHVARRPGPARPCCTAALRAGPARRAGRYSGLKAAS